MFCKIKILTSFLCVFLLFSWQTVIACIANSDNVIEVSIYGPCTDIQTAINASNGIDPYTINILPGEYTLDYPLNLTSNIELIGAGGDLTILNGNNQISYLIRLQQLNTITISGLTLNTGGIYSEETTALIITDNIINKAKIAIYTYAGSNISVTFNTLNNARIGINVEETEQITIDSNIIEGDATQRFSMVLYDTFITVTNNDLLNGTGDGILLGYGDYTITGNIISICNGMGIHIHEHSSVKTAANKEGIYSNIVTCNE